VELVRNLDRLEKQFTAEISHDEWLEKRRKTIGGSDASAIVHLNKWSSPYRVWAQKTGRLPETEDNERMRQGRDLEGYVAERWMEKTGKRVRRENSTLYSPRYPFAHASIDRWVVGEDAGLECKTTSVLNVKAFKGGEFPDQYWAQCLHYMAVTGAAKWYLAVLVLNEGFYTYEIERTKAVQTEIDALMTAEEDFFKCLAHDTPPPVDGAAATSSTLISIYSGGLTDSVNLMGHEVDVERYVQLKDNCRQLEEEMERIKQGIMVDLGNSEKGHCGNFIVSWAAQSRSNFDAKAYVRDNPTVDLSRYYRALSYRKFEIKRKQPP
jgi:putative phage-type endonuclease